MKNLYVSGYRSYELNIFKKDDERIFYIKEFLKRRLSDYIEAGLEWVIITGQMGTEIWAGEVVIELKKDYPDIKLGILIPYNGFSDNWNEQNQQVFNVVRQQADYVNYTSSKEYQNLGQLKGNQEFVLSNTDGTLLFYDTSNEGKPKYLLNMIEKIQEREEYELEKISFDELQLFVTEYEETHFEQS